MISFDTSMKISTNYSMREDHDFWNILQDCYNKNINSTPSQRIPKYIHQIWLGKKIPTELLQLTDTVRQYNPDYNYKLWTDDDINIFDDKTKQQFNSTPNLGQRSDILRYAILEKHGGIYLDTDFTCHRSFDSLLHVDFFIGIAYDKTPTLFNGLLGTAPGNTLIKSINNILEISYNDGMGVIRSTGPLYITDRIRNNYKVVEKFLALPVTYFYPFPNFSQDRIYGDDYKKYVKPETICTHLWHSRWN